MVWCVQSINGVVGEISGIEKETLIIVSSTAFDPLIRAHLASQR